MIQSSNIEYIMYFVKSVLTLCMYQFCFFDDFWYIYIGIFSMIPTYFKIEILAKCCSWTTLCSKGLIAKYSIVLFHYCVGFFGTRSGRKFQFHFKIYKSLYEFEIHRDIWIWKGFFCLWMLKWSRETEFFSGKVTGKTCFLNVAKGFYCILFYIILSYFFHTIFYYIIFILFLYHIF